MDPGNNTLLSKGLYQPNLETSMRALAHHYRLMDRPPGTLVKFTVEGAFVQTWWLKKGTQDWQLLLFSKVNPRAELTLPAELAWRICRPGTVAIEAADALVVRGDSELALHFLTSPGGDGIIRPLGFRVLRRLDLGSIGEVFVTFRTRDRAGILIFFFRISRGPFTQNHPRSFCFFPVALSERQVH